MVAGVFPAGGRLGTAPDGIMRPQPTWAGGRIAYLFATARRYLPETHQCFADRARRNKGDKGAGNGKGKPGKGKGKGKGSSFWLILPRSLSVSSHPVRCSCFPCLSPFSFLPSYPFSPPVLLTCCSHSLLLCSA